MCSVLLAKAIYNIDKHLKIQGTLGTDINNMNFDEFIARTTPGVLPGKLTNSIFNNRTLNAELLALYNNNWGNFDFNATVGGNIFKVDNKTTVITGTDQQMDGVESIMNYAEQSAATVHPHSRRQTTHIFILRYQEVSSFLTFSRTIKS